MGTGGLGRARIKRREERKGMKRKTNLGARCTRYADAQCPSAEPGLRTGLEKKSTSSTNLTQEIGFSLFKKSTDSFFCFFF